MTFQHSSLRVDDSAAYRSFPARTLLTFAILTVGAAIQVRGGLNLDVSWFMTFAERTLQGAVPYVDVSDPNPPASIMMYLPAMAISLWTGIKAEALVVAQTLALAVLSVRLTTRMNGPGRSLLATEAAALAALTIAPAAMFAEREHYAAIACVPAVAAIVALGRGRDLSPLLRFAAGCAAALTVAFKPHFAAAIALPAVYATVRRRSLLWISWPEIAGFVSILTAYVATAYIVYPAYFTIALPEAIRLYAAAHADFSIAISNEAMWFMLAIVAASVLVAITTNVSAAAAGSAFASVGFAAAYFVQQRYQLNHTSAAIEVASVTMIEFALTAITRSLALRAICLCLALQAPIFLRIQASLMQTMGEPALATAVKSLLPANGRIGAISDSLELMFPMARHTGALWVNRYNSEWRYATAVRIFESTKPDATAAAYLNGIIASDRAQLAEDLTKGLPDVIIIDNAAVRLRETADPGIARSLAPYRLAKTVETTVGSTELWTRR